ncbi:UNVERIFIED_CONTAM: hypothetical protein Slati_3091000 [Sesamum latifolium]|uniref:Uncharacterized protein n=1 Tax=Sesamum latifolium TaxID=2727402 RepID=A0AAW2UU86_9LAMI
MCRGGALRRGQKHSYTERTKDSLDYGGGELILEAIATLASSRTMTMPKSKWWCGCLEEFQAGYTRIPPGS